jgi:hypothetical protein
VHHVRIFSRVGAFVIGAGIGRVLVASLHQAISDELPTRVEFYEHWLGGQRMRDGSVGLAPMSAVLGFLRTEGAPYHEVMARAGTYAAEWSVDALPAMRRRMLMALPRRWRLRQVLALAGATIRQGYEPARITTRVRRSEGRVTVTNSLFCRVREPQTAPLCDFHAALVVQMLKRFGLPAAVRIDQCLGTRGHNCELVIEVGATE